MAGQKVSDKCAVAAGPSLAEQGFNGNCAVGVGPTTRVIFWCRPQAQAIRTTVLAAQKVNDDSAQAVDPVESMFSQLLGQKVNGNCAEAVGPLETKFSELLGLRVIGRRYRIKVLSASLAEGHPQQCSGCGPVLKPCLLAEQRVKRPWAL